VSSASRRAQLDFAAVSRLRFGMGSGLARDSLAAVVREAFGPGRRPGRVERLRGGTKKGVYRLFFDDESTAVAYVWDPAENYWPQQDDAPGAQHADPFADASGGDLFEAAQVLLAGLGVRTPRIYLLDRSQATYPAEIALVEDVRGGTLETQLERGRAVPRQALGRLREALEVMHQQRATGFGKIAGPRTAAAGRRSCEQVVLDRALSHLDQAAARVGRLAAVRGDLADIARELAAAVRPRTQYGLIHGELGPDHVLIDERGDPVIIDIEGLVFFDVEWEHAFLRLRFGEHYRWLRAADLDEQRLRFYDLALSLSLIAGPLRLLDGDFPDRGPMLEIAEVNTDRALAFLR
jgi:Phosphotransferase enzyme family